MLDRAIETRDTVNYDYQAGNINEYGTVENMVEGGWLFMMNWGDFVMGTIVTVWYTFWWTLFFWA